MILFHITPEVNLPSIIQHGLIINAKERGFVSTRNKKRDVLFLTDDPECILDVQCGQSWINAAKPWIISIDISGLPIQRWESEYVYPSKEHEFICRQCIGPERILHYKRCDKK